MILVLEWAKRGYWEAHYCKRFELRIVVYAFREPIYVMGQRVHHWALKVLSSFGVAELYSKLLKILHTWRIFHWGLQTIWNTISNLVFMPFMMSRKLISTKLIQTTAAMSQNRIWPVDLPFLLYTSLGTSWKSVRTDKNQKLWVRRENEPNV